MGVQLASLENDPLDVDWGAAVVSGGEGDSEPSPIATPSKLSTNAESIYFSYS
jgi:hypothetical protein